MKRPFRRVIPLLLLPNASLLLCSCANPGDRGGANHLSGGGSMTYSSLPVNYSGDAYLHGGRFYTGGQYEKGEYHDLGRAYVNRYYHNGEYYYGGKYQNHSRGVTRPEYRRNQDRPDYRGIFSPQGSSGPANEGSSESSSHYSQKKPGGPS